MGNWEYGDFKEAVLRLTGINLSAYNEKQMRRRIDSLILHSGYKDYYSYYKFISTNTAGLKKFTNYITINVTEFYRNPAQWDKLEKLIMPKLIEKKKPLKVWSSACSTGEEAYSLVMLLNQFYPLSEIKVLATDIDEEAIEKAVLGVYTEKSMSNLPQGYIEKYFDYKENVYFIKDRVKKCVEFRKLNLLEDPFPQGCHLILCRNVMIYFTEEAKDSLYKKLHDALAPNGVLFLGSTEQIVNPARYNFTSLGAFFYLCNKEDSFQQRNKNIRELADQIRKFKI